MSPAPVVVAPGGTGAAWFVTARVPGGGGSGLAPPAAAAVGEGSGVDAGAAVEGPAAAGAAAVAGVLAAALVGAAEPFVAGVWLPPAALAAVLSTLLLLLLEGVGVVLAALLAVPQGSPREVPAQHKALAEVFRRLQPAGRC